MFRLADNFHFFDVTPATAADAQKLETTSGPNPWIDDAHQLYVSQWKLNWHDPGLLGAHPFDSPSLFNPEPRLRIVKKGSRWIAMHWDKRDDDMRPFERLPRLVTLKKDGQTVQVRNRISEQGISDRVVHSRDAGFGYAIAGTDGPAGSDYCARDRQANRIAGERKSEA